MSSVKHSKLRRYTTYTLITLVLVFLLLATTISTFLATESGSRYVANYALATVDAMEDISVSAGDIRGNLLQGLQLQQVEFAMPGVSASIATIAASWNPSSLFAGRFLMSALSIDGLRLALEETEPAEPATPGSDPLAGFGFTPLPVTISIGEFAVTNSEIVSAGSSTSLQAIRAGIELAGQELTLSDLDVQVNPVAVNGEINLQLSDGIPLQVALNWQYTDALPMELGTASGQLQLDGDLRALTVEHSLQSPFLIETSGEVINPLVADALTLDFIHRSDVMTLPLTPQVITLRDTQLVTSGSISDLALNLGSTVSTPDYPQVQLSFAGDVAGSELRVSTLQVSTATGELSTNGVVSWADALAINGNFSLQENDVTAYLSQPLLANVGQITAAGGYEVSLAAAATSNDEGSVSASFTLASATAEIDDYELSATGAVAWIENRLQIESLLVESNNNRITVQGEYQDEIDLQWQIDAPALAQFIPGVNGQVTGSGFATGDPTQPDIDGELQIAALNTDSVDIETLTIVLTGQGGNYAFDLQLANARLQGEGTTTISSATINASGSIEQQQLSARIESSVANLELDMAGRMVDQATTHWEGTVSRAALSGAVGEWRLARPIALAWQNEQLTLDETCWGQRQTQLCVRMTPDSNGGYNLAGELSEFPLSEFNSDSDHLLPLSVIPRLPEDISLTGLLNASLAASFGPERQPTFSFNSRAPNSVLSIRTVATDEFGAVTSDAEIIEQDYSWEALSLEGELQEGRWQFVADARLGQRSIEDSSVNLDGRIQANLDIAADGTLQGTTTASFQDLGWIAGLVPDLTNVVGQLDSEVDIGGTLEAPEIQGFVQLQNGSFLVESTGVTYHDIELAVNSTDTANGEFSGSLSGGDGVINLSGTFSDLTSDNWGVNATIAGEAFQLVQIPELDLQIAPDLEIIVDANQFAILGDLVVPRLLLTLRELPPSAVDISRDVVIVDYPQERPEMGRSFTTGQTSVAGLPLVFDINLQLGSDVEFSGFGLQAALEGELSIRQLSNGTNLTYGELDVTSGSYELYGQSLQLREGELLFLGNYHNPAINIRAVRVVNSLTVGVLMNGTVRNLRSELFSTPSLPESDIISVLVTGRPVSELQSGEGTSVLGAITTLGLRRSESISQQIGSTLGLDTVAITNSGDVDSSVLTVGKYITPDIFIRYGVGLFDNASKVAVDYSINDRLTLQAESGEYQSVDLTYKVER